MTLLEEIDELLSSLEDTAHGSEGMRITEMRFKIQKESSRIEEIAIGFSIWTEKNGWDWSGNHKVFINNDFEPKEGSELFALYMESIKP